MTALDTPFRAIASALLGNFGTPVTLVWIDQQYDPDTLVTTPVEVVETHRGRVGKYRSEQIDGAVIRVGDVPITLAARDWTRTPTADARVRFQGQEWAIEKVWPTYSGDEVATYVLQARA